MASRPDLRARGRRSPRAALPATPQGWVSYLRLDRPRAPAFALGAAMLAAAVLLYLDGHDQIFWYDEWAFVLGRRSNDVATFLEPHNQHLSLVPIALYRVLLVVGGMDDYGLFRLTVILFHLLCVGLVFAYAARRVDGWLAFAAAFLLLTLGPAWQVIVWPFQVAWLISLAAGLGALLLLDRRDRAGDVGAALLIAVSLGSSGLGVPVALGVLVELLWRRPAWGRLWVALGPLALYGLWYLAYAESDPARHAVNQLFIFVADSAAAALSSLVGLAGQAIPDTGASLDWGRPLALIAVGVLVWRLARIGSVSARLAMLLAAVLVFWGLTGVSRAGFAPPFSSRYIYVGAFFMVLIAVELMRGVRVGRTAGILLAVVLTAGLVAHVGAFRDAARYLREQSTVRAANLGAIEIARDTVDPNFSATPYVGAANFLALAATEGSPALSPDEIAGALPAARASADDVLLRIHRVALQPGGEPARSGDPPTVDASAGGRVTEDGACVTLRPSAYQPPFFKPGLDLTVPAGGLVLTAPRGEPVNLSLRRFAAEFPERSLGRLAGGATATLTIPRDRAPQPWHVHLAPTGAVTACQAGPSGS